MASNISLENLPSWAKLEVTKADLEAFAHTILAQFKRQDNAPSVSDKRILTMDELATYLSTAKQTIYGWVHHKKIPYHKQPTGRKTYFLKEEIDKWLTTNRTATSAEVEEEAARHIDAQKMKKKAKR